MAIRSGADSLGVVVHDDGHAVKREAVGLGHHALPEPVRDMIRAEQASDGDREVERDEGEGDGVPPAEDEALELEVSFLAPREDRAGVACLRDGRFDERAEIAAAVELVLDAEAAVGAEGAGPLGVDLALEVERATLVCDVAGGDEEGEADPKQEGKDGEEGAVVE